MHKKLKKRTDYYHLLHVQPDAPFEIIRASYLALMRDLKMHPDLGGEHFNAALLNEAYETLSDSVRRAEYDMSLPLSARQGNGKRCVMVATVHDSAPGPAQAGHDHVQADGRRTMSMKEHVSSASSDQPRCRRCRSHLRRKRRTWWMRLLPFTKSYFCPLCKSSFIALNSRLIRV